MMNIQTKAMPPLDCSTALIEELETEKAADGCRESYDLPEQALRQTNMESRS